jgi:hypothetical protein
MRASQFFIATLKEAPSDAEIISHQLMLRAGLIRRLAGGIYTWMPMGLRVLRKVENIVRQEMDRAGAIELLMPAVQPFELWEESGRGPKYGPELLRFKGPSPARFRDRTDPRGSHHRRGAARGQELPPVAASLLPGPDQVPRRNPAAFSGSCAGASS